MDIDTGTSQALAAAITKKASKQTYITIRLLIDGKLVDDAYRAYGYFRWVDDTLDAQAGTRSEKLSFISRQKALLEALYQGDSPKGLCEEEHILADLVHNDSGTNPGLKSYLFNMMAVMEFDAERRGRVISTIELDEYALTLATAVTDAIYYFIDHDHPPEPHLARYRAVTAAHITHMLRDTLEDVSHSYYNIPGEYLQAHGISTFEVESNAYHQWVCSRVRQARGYFKEGKGCIAQDKSWRRRLAGYAYSARFEWMLRTIERDNFCLRSEYGERKGLWAGVWMSWVTLTSTFASPWSKTGSSHQTAQPVVVEEP